MKFRDGALHLAATDLSNHLSCAHLTSLDVLVARGEHGGHTNFDPLAKILQERGRAHENEYVAYLQARGFTVESAHTLPSPLELIHAGVDVITQANLTSPRWQGRADFLVRVERPSPTHAWSYEVIDTKLATETRAGTLLQLCVYSDLLGQLQGVDPAQMHVVTPGIDFPKISFRFAELAAIYRAFRADAEAHVAAMPPTYPEPRPSCDICGYRNECEARRRADDHLSLVADLGRLHQRELARVQVTSVAQLATVPLPWPFKPERGSAATYDRLARQARLQVEARALAVPPYELLAREPERGFARLPAPSELDIFLDFEGDPFIGDAGREFLFGWYTHDRGYECLWATDDATEHAAFEHFMTLVHERWERDRGLHIYHYAPYEPTALKRLAGRYGTRTDELARVLRGKRLVDLYAITRSAMRIGVESYSIKSLEPLVGYTRPVPLEQTGPSVRAVRLALQRGMAASIEPAWRADVEAYNRGDCESTLALRDWLEHRRAELIAAGESIARPPLIDGHPEEVTEVRAGAALAAARLLDGVSENREQRDAIAQARWLLGHLMEWYRREQSVVWWEFFRLADTTDEQRLDEPYAIAGLTFVERTRHKRSYIDRYSFPLQDVIMRTGEELHRDADTKLGTIFALDPANRVVEIKKTKASLDVPITSVFASTFIPARPKDSTLVAIGTRVADEGFIAEPAPSLVRDLLFRAPPRGLAPPGAPLRHPGESLEACCRRLALALDGAVLPIQGPPGTGKTSRAADMIVELVAAGRRVGVTATSHAVIENLVRRAVAVAATNGQPLRVALRSDEPDDDAVPTAEYVESAELADRLGEFDLIGGTAWHWARADMQHAVDVLFIDEAGQLCLADAIAVTGATKSLVLVGDPQQLEQPIQGSHPDGIRVSVLQHMIGDEQTIAPDRGLLLDETHRLHPTICRFTSEQFYASELRAGPGTDLQGIATPRLVMPGLYWHPVAHDGNQNRSPEEAQAVATLIAECVQAGAIWTDSRGVRRALTQRDVRVVAPFNAHVGAIRDALVARGLRDVPVGTVDKFQGQEAAIAIYSMATSHPDDAPRGLAFLYDRHRLNVATSRAKCACVVIASPRLLRPTCRTPEHLHLASALARYVELAHPL